MKKVIVSVGSLLNCLNETKKVMNKRTPLPVLENFLIRVKDNRMRVYATDLENTLIAECGCETNVNSKEFTFILDGTVPKFLSKFDDQPLTLSYKDAGEDGGELTIEIHTDGDKVKYKCMAWDQYPMIPETEATNEVDLSDIGGMLEFCGKDELRPVMTGVCILKEGDGLSMCATNAHWLKVVETTGTMPEKIESMIIPPLALKIIKGLKKVGVTKYGMIDNGSGQPWCMQMEFPTVTLICRLIDGRYPQFRAVIPTEASTWLTFDKKDMLKTIDKAAMFANPTTMKVDFEMNGVTKITAEDLDFERNYSVEKKYNKKGLDLHIAFNAEFLSGIIKDCKEDTVTMEMSLPNRAAVIKEGKAMRLLMPIMLDSNWKG